MSPLLPELREAEATGEKAAIYAQMKRLGAVPMVALIFRHIATLPGGLEWTWNAVGPAWRSGQLQEAAWRIARETRLTPLAAMPRAALSALGVDDAALAEIRVVLEAYNRANPENMLSVLCLLRLAAGRASSSPEDRGAGWSPPPVPGPLVAMGDVTRMPREVAELLDLVAAPGEPGAPRVIQSLYRHFMHRPAFLALAVTLLRQRFDDGSIDPGAASMRTAMNAAADGISTGLSAPPAPAGIRTVCERFGGAVIPQMIVVGALLERALPAT